MNNIRSANLAACSRSCVTSNIAAPPARPSRITCSTRPAAWESNAAVGSSSNQTLGFSDNARAWRGELVAAKPANVKKAVQFVRTQFNMNGTNTHAALMAAFDQARADTIFLLSDGHPSVGSVTDPEKILLDVRRRNRTRRLRIHGIALMRGDPPPAFASLENRKRSLAFMKRLTAENDGRFKLIE